MNKTFWDYIDECMQGDCGRMFHIYAAILIAIMFVIVVAAALPSCIVGIPYLYWCYRRQRGGEEQP